MTLRSTLDRKFWSIAAGGTLVALLVLGVPSAVLPNPFFIRMLPTEPVNVLVWFLSAPLMGLLLASYLSPPRLSGYQPPSDVGFVQASGGSLAAYLAIGCPICNKIIVAVMGVSGALNVVAPLQPMIGAASLALLGATLVWRMRLRAKGCARCVPAASPAG
jgi:hypothetical protein